MIIQTNKFSIKLEEIPKERFLHNSYTKTELKVFSLINHWINKEKEFSFKTSGSTGIPKEIRISREKIEYSVETTFESIDPKGTIKTCLLCLDPNFIGGAMAIFRALQRGLDIYIIEPTTRIIESIPPQLSFDLVSMVPMQFQNIPQNQIHRFKNILVGGGPLYDNRKKLNSNVYSTFGMTETVSHIALRKIDRDEFSCIGDTLVRNNTDGCLEFQGSITNNKWLKTNDLGEVISPVSFKWIGRKDFIINSGGIKLNPENIEEKLKSQIQGNFIISSIPDKNLGDKLILLAENDLPSNLNYNGLSKYEIPKEVYSKITFIRTSSDKIDRLKTKDLFIQSL